MDVTAKSSGPDIMNCVLINPSNDNLIALQNAFEEIHPAGTGAYSRVPAAGCGTVWRIDSFAVETIRYRPPRCPERLFLPRSLTLLDFLAFLGLASLFLL